MNVDRNNPQMVALVDESARTMLVEERRRHIVDLLDKKKRVKVRELGKPFLRFRRDDPSRPGSAL